ncbi:unnamed protein product [Rotaria sp. Silwood2]|nr:unnamed protein product [Rotaria sp. Silwood2]CAF3024250.1 unnamed protein product [Rotaria sp. Silwood2]CAF3353353.1 unnamed protein product [Rotaria sp. Silwood2]
MNTFKLFFFLLLNLDRHFVSGSPSNDSSSSEWSTNNMLISFCLIIMLILLSVNIFLFIKLNKIDRMTDRLIENNPLWSNGYIIKRN